MSVHDLKNDVQRVADPVRGQFLQRFFKTGKGEYAEGDLFLGLTVPQSREIAKKYHDISLDDCRILLMSKFHEERLIALFILVWQFSKGDEKKKEEIYDVYLSYTRYVNNWDLVDSSAHKIVGEYLWKRESSIKTRNTAKQISHKVRDDGVALLDKLALSGNLWERRIAILATFAFINHKEAEPTLHIAELLLQDKHDLIHKAVGWALREVGKRVSREDEESFLKKHYKIMPRTMLRYAIELFPEERRKAYLLGEI